MQQYFDNHCCVYQNVYSSNQYNVLPLRRQSDKTGGHVCNFSVLIGVNQSKVDQ